MRPLAAICHTGTSVHMCACMHMRVCRYSDELFNEEELHAVEKATHSRAQIRFDNMLAIHFFLNGIWAIIAYMVRPPQGRCKGHTHAPYMSVCACVCVRMLLQVLACGAGSHGMNRQTGRRMGRRMDRWTDGRVGGWMLTLKHMISFECCVHVCK